MDICTCFHSYSLIRAFSNPCVSVNTLSLSRVDIVISRSGSPLDASHLPSYARRCAAEYCVCAIFGTMPHAVVPSITSYDHRLLMIFANLLNTLLLVLFQYKLIAGINFSCQKIRNKSILLYIYDYYPMK